MSKRIAAINPSASLIFLHGLGDTADGWGMLAQELRRAGLDHINLVLPTAPVQYVSGFHQRSTSWFDIRGLGASIGHHNDGFGDSLATVKSLVEKEIAAGIPASRIVVGGFSQGGALALGSAIDLDLRLAGFMVHSGFLSSNVAKPAPATAPLNTNTPILVIHGKSDDVVDFEACGEPAYKALKEYGFSSVTWKPYAGLPHTASLETIGDMLEFLRENLGRK